MLHARCVMDEQRLDRLGEESALIERACAGDERAFELIVERYSRGVLAYCRRMVRQNPIAEDLAQEVFVKLYFALSRFDARKALAPFLFRIAHNHCLDWLRARKLPVQSMTDGEGDAPPREWPDARPTPEQQVLRDEVSAAVETALSSVPELYRSVLLMRHVHEFSYEEIAEALGLPIGTVKARIHRGRERLQQELAGLVDF